MRAMTLSGAVSLAVAAVLALTACPSAQESLIARKQELRKVLDDAYEAYGGGQLAADAKAQAAKGGEPDRTAARLVGELDRTFFEEYCLAAGRGERPFNLSEKLEAWVKANGATCRRAAELQAKVDELARKVQ